MIQLGGPWWRLDLGRRDARTASESKANRDLPSPLSSLERLVKSFKKKGMNERDLTALSGAHTIGQAQCFLFRSRIYNDTDIDPKFVKARQANCPWKGGNKKLAALDERSPNKFDNQFFKNLMKRQGLLHSDQVLFNNQSVGFIVRQYSMFQFIFFKDFSRGMTKLSNISPLTGKKGEIRKNCRRVN